MTDLHKQKEGNKEENRRERSKKRKKEGGDLVIKKAPQLDVGIGGAERVSVWRDRHRRGIKKRKEKKDRLITGSVIPEKKRDRGVTKKS